MNGYREPRLEIRAVGFLFQGYRCAWRYDGGVGAYDAFYGLGGKGL